MRKAVVPLVLTALFVAAAIFSGCEEIAPGEVITETKDFSGFNYVDAGSAFEVEITRSDSYSVIISADESLFDYVEVSKVGATLKIYLNPRHILTDFTLGAKTLKAEITMPDLYGLELSGASKGTITGFQSSHDFNLVVSGASTLEIVNIGVGNTDIEVSGASRVNGDMTAHDTRFEISGASNCELSGSADKMVLVVSGASRVDQTDFPLNSANIELSGASEATVHVTGRLDITASGASRLYFYGNPTLGYTNVSGASTLKHK
jgi:hypothetical protein